MMVVRFEDTDPRPRDVSPGFARQRAERQRAADEESKPDRLEELGRGLAALVSPHKPPAPEGYAEAVDEANRRAAALYPQAVPIYAEIRRAYVAGFVDHWLASR